MMVGYSSRPAAGPLFISPQRARYKGTGLLYARLLDTGIFDWLSGYPDLWAALLYVLAGQYEHAGTLGELVVQADQASVAQELGGDPNKALAAPRHALQRKLLDGLRYLLREELKLNQPQASDGWLTQDALWLVSKTVSDKLRAHLLAQGIDGIPSSNTAVFNVLQDHGIAQQTPEGKAIWKAAVSSDTGWSHSFTLLRLAPSLIWEGDERPALFAGTVTVAQEEGDSTIPVSPPAVVESAVSEPLPAPPAGDGIEALLDLLGTPEMALAVLSSGSELLPPTIEESPLESEEPRASVESKEQAPASTSGLEETPSGEHFIAWLRRRIEAHTLIINEAKALVHTVADTVYLVSPGVFQRYAQEHPKTAFLAKQDQVSDWQWVQKRFEKLQLHRKQQNGLNIWTCTVTGPRKSRRLHGYLLEDPHALFNNTPPNNPYLSLSHCNGLT